ncbi:FAD-dependent oxidoreductase, partial [Parapedobacter sp.]
MSNWLRKYVVSLSLLIALFHLGIAQDQILVEAESFGKTGGWVVDQQSFPVIHSSYLMAHGMGRPVADAATQVHFAEKGTYHLWVRTKDWAPFPKGPGKFEVWIDGKPVGGVFGESGKVDWMWYEGGKVTINRDSVEIRLKDLTGFNGRCDALLFTRSAAEPPQDSAGMALLRKKLLHLDDTRQDAGHFDLVVVGGGIAGTCAAISAARLGLTVALIQDRPVLGGNNSSEVRVHLMGDVDKNHYPKLGRIVRELDNGDPGNGNPNAKEYGDKRKTDIIKYEKNISLFLNTHVYQVEMDGDRIAAVIGRNIRTNRETRFTGTYFSDCTGDGTVGYLAGADYRMGRESRAQTGESFAPEKSDDFTLGTSNLWASLPVDSATTFPETPW